MNLFLRNPINNVKPFRHFFNQFVHFFRRVLEIIIYGDDNFMFCQPYPTEQRIVLAIISHQVNSTNSGIIIG
jgi:hypothetical protein